MLNACPDVRPITKRYIINLDYFRVRKRTNMSTSMCSKSACKSTSSSFTKAFMLPSTIYHIYSEPNNILSHVVDQCVIDVSRKILHNGDLPKLQVVQKDGKWFSLNNAQLDLCRRLEEEGKCSKVKVDVVPMKQVPGFVVAMMTIPDQKRSAEVKLSTKDANRPTSKGYERLDQSEGGDTSNQVTDSEAEESGTESSDFADSDSEYDWSESDEETSDLGSAGATEDEQSTDNEKDTLL